MSCAVRGMILTSGTWVGPPWHARSPGHPKHPLPDLEQPPGSAWPDEHQEPLVKIFDKDGMVVRMKDVVIADAVLAGTLGDDRIALHIHKLPCA